MIHSFAEASPYTDWQDPTEGSADAPKNKLRKKLGGKKLPAEGKNNENRPHKAPKIIPSWKQPEATIWAREPESDDQDKTVAPADMPDVDRMHAFEHTAPPTAQTVAQSPQPPKVTEHETDDDTSWVQGFAAAPSAVHPAVQLPAQDTGDDTWTDYSREQPSKYQHSFWDEPGAGRRNQGNHDTLPAVPVAQTPEQAESDNTTPVEVTGEHQMMTGLEDAVNPNLVPDQPLQSTQTESIVVPASSDEPQVPTPELDANFLGRRSSEPDVQSTAMAGSLNFEQMSSGDGSIVDEDETEPPSEMSDFYTAVAEQTPVPEAPDEASAEVMDAYAPDNDEDDAIQVAPEFGVSNQHEIESEPAAKPELFVDHVMERSDLLALAKSIRIDGVSVHEMFTAKRIDEEGLRRIVAEYLRGGDLKKMISQELIRQQMKFERDPQLRSLPLKPTAKSAASDTTKRAASRIKQQAQSLRAKDRTERLAEVAHNTLERAEAVLSERPNIIQAASIAAIVVIYVTILIVALLK